jgi:hypothetical protein
VPSVRVPFSIPEVYGGLAQAYGMATVDETGLALEFEVKDGLIGALSSGVKEVRIPLAEIAAVVARTGPFGGKLVVETRSLAPASRVPKSKGGRIELKVARSSREAAKEAESLLSVALSRREIDDLRRDLGRKRDGEALPPGGEEQG